MFILYIIIISLIIYIIFKKNVIETGYWGPWGYSDKYEWIYPDGYKAYIPSKEKYKYQLLNNSIYLPYEYWL